MIFGNFLDVLVFSRLNFYLKLKWNCFDARLSSLIKANNSAVLPMVVYTMHEFTVSQYQDGGADSGRFCRNPLWRDVDWARLFRFQRTVQSIVTRFHFVFLWIFQTFSIKGTFILTELLRYLREVRKKLRYLEKNEILRKIYILCDFFVST